MAFSLSDWDGSGGGGKLPVKAELTTSPGISALDGPTTNVKSGTQKSTVKTAANPVKVRAMRKKDLTAEEYFYPEKPTYKSGNFLFDFVSDNPWLITTPVVGDFIKSKAYELAKQSNSATRDIKDINLVLGAEPTPEQKKILDFYKANKYYSNYTGVESDNLGDKRNLDLLRQYLYQDQNLTPAIYKPTSDYYEFLPSYSLKDKLGSTKSDSVLQSILNYKPEFKDSQILNKGLHLAASKRRAKISKQQANDLESVIKTHKPVFYSDETKFPDGTMLPNLTTSLFYDFGPDLGHYKTGFGWDNELNLPYAAISDAWDFYPKDYGKQWVDRKDKEKKDERNTQSYQQSYLMHKAGKGFKVYDRVYIDPKTKKTISDKEIINRRNMLKSMKKPK